MDFMLGQGSFLQPKLKAAPLSTDIKEVFSKALNFDEKAETSIDSKAQAFTQALESIAALVNSDNQQSSVAHTNELQEVAALLADVKQQLKQGDIEAQDGEHTEKLDEGCEHGHIAEQLKPGYGITVDSESLDTQTLLDQLQEIESLVASLNQSPSDPKLEQQLSQLIAQDLNQIHFKTPSEFSKANEIEMDAGLKSRWLSDLLNASQSGDEKTANGKDSQQNNNQLKTASEFTTPVSPDPSSKLAASTQSKLQEELQQSMMTNKASENLEAPSKLSSLDAKLVKEGIPQEKDASLLAGNSQLLSKLNADEKVGLQNNDKSLPEDEAFKAANSLSSDQVKPILTDSSKLAKEVALDRANQDVKATDRDKGPIPLPKSVNELSPNADEKLELPSEFAIKSDARDKQSLLDPKPSNTLDKEQLISQDKNALDDQRYKDALKTSNEDLNLKNANKGSEQQNPPLKLDAEIAANNQQSRSERQEQLLSSTITQSMGQSSDSQQQSQNQSQNQSQQQQTSPQSMSASLQASAESKEQALWLQRPIVANQMQSELNERVQYMAAKGLQAADIRLDPGDLGSVQIRLQMTQDGATVQIQAQNPQTRELLEQNMPRLREMLSQQGIEYNNNSQGSDQGRAQQQMQNGQSNSHGFASGSASNGDSEHEIESNQMANEPPNNSSVIDFYA